MAAKDDTKSDSLGTYTELAFPPVREDGIDTVRIGMAKGRIPMLAEIDVAMCRGIVLAQPS